MVGLDRGIFGKQNLIEIDLDYMLPQAMLKGPKRSFVVVLLLVLLGVKSLVKKVTKLTKSVSKQKNITEVTEVTNKT